MKIDKKKTILLVMDYQNDIVHEKGKYAAWGLPAHVKEQNAIANTKKVLEAARKAGVRVVFVKVQYKKGYPEVSKAVAPFYKGLPQSGSLIEGDWGAEIHDELVPQKGETVVVKSRVNPFTNPKFEKELKGARTLILCGVATNFVVEETVREAAGKNYEVIVAEDCCASMGKEAHDFSMKNILPNFAVISSSGDIVAALK